MRHREVKKWARCHRQLTHDLIEPRVLNLLLEVSPPLEFDNYFCAIAPRCAVGCTRAGSVSVAPQHRAHRGCSVCPQGQDPAASRAQDAWVRFSLLGAGGCLPQESLGGRGWTGFPLAQVPAAEGARGALVGCTVCLTPVLCFLPCVTVAMTPWPLHIWLCDLGGCFWVSTGLT